MPATAQGAACALRGGPVPEMQSPDVYPLPSSGHSQHDHSKADPMRILMVNYEFPPVGGGGATANYYLAREMVRLGHEVTVLTSATAGVPLRETLDGIDVRRVRVFRRRRDFTSVHEMLQYITFATPRALWLAAWAHWDVIQTFFAVPSGLVGCWAARASRAVQVVRIGGGDLPGHERRFGLLHRLLRPVVGRVLRKVQARVVNSEGMHERATQAYPRLDFEIIYNGIDLELFHPTDGVPRDVPTVLFVSRLIERKGLQLLLPALATLMGEGVAFALMVVGDGPMREKLEEQTAALGLAERTEFLGLRPREEVPALYRRGDVFCLPSSSEGMANVILEALATGLPIITTRVPGTTELVVDGINGFVVPADDAAALVGPLRQLLSDAALRARMGARSRERSEAFSWTLMAERYVALYEKLISDRALRRARRPVHS
ncbi:MAG TPA: glycosyltransferase family 4 protein [Armatimonadetes bacterium]|nr:glycosyltransferase family 4 protein [Armatimonadota bacterium]